MFTKCFRRRHYRRSFHPGTDTQHDTNILSDHTSTQCEQFLTVTRILPYTYIPVIFYPIVILYAIIFDYTTNTVDNHILIRLSKPCEQNFARKKGKKKGERDGVPRAKEFESLALSTELFAHFYGNAINALQLSNCILFPPQQ